MKKYSEDDPRLVEWKRQWENNDGWVRGRSCTRKVSRLGRSFEAGFIYMFFLCNPYYKYNQSIIILYVYLHLQVPCSIRAYTAFLHIPVVCVYLDGNIRTAYIIVDLKYMLCTLPYKVLFLEICDWHIWKNLIVKCEGFNILSFLDFSSFSKSRDASSFRDALILPLYLIPNFMSLSFIIGICNSY